MYNGPDNSNGFIPFGLMRDLKNLRDPDEIIFEPTASELNKKALAAVREVVARRHHFDPKDDKATPAWDTIEDRAMINAFSLGLQAVLGLIGVITLAVGGIGVMNIKLVSGDRANPGDRPAQGDRSAAAAHSGAVPAGSAGTHFRGRSRRNGGG
jgi:hypothetical protein